jgi:hypothetical protein
MTDERSFGITSVRWPTRTAIGDGDYLELAIEAVEE